jgi:hypothetical protein
MRAAGELEFRRHSSCHSFAGGESEPVCPAQCGNRRSQDGTHPGDQDVQKVQIV